MKKKQKKFQSNDRNLQHFRTLGLPRGECRIDVIRDAAIKIAKSSVNRSHPVTTDLHRAKVAVAAYKLLDPRNRNGLYERVQLSCPLDEEEIHRPVRESTSNLNRQLVDCQQSRATAPLTDESSGDDLSSRGLASSADANGEDTELSLTEKRQVVQLLREGDSSEGNLRNLSPLGWLRSYLKI